jgi:hypothetical protein
MRDYQIQRQLWFPSAAPFLFKVKVLRCQQKGSELRADQNFKNSVQQSLRAEKN